MNKLLALMLALSVHGMGQCSMALAAEPAKKSETIAFEVKEAPKPVATPAAADATGAIAVPAQAAPSPEAALSEASIKAANEEMIKAEEEKLAKQVEEVTEPPGWLKSAIGFALKMPYVGPILVQVMQWMGVLAAFLTALAGLMLALMKLLSKMGKSVQFLVKINGYLAKLYPWVAWLSMFNVADNKKQDDGKKVA